jgi:flagellar export protein FliJ
MTALDSMVRVHSWVLDEKQRKLADLRALLQKLTDDLANLDKEFDAEREAAGTSDEAGAAYPAFVAAALDRRRKLCQSIANLEKECEAARQEVTEAFGELKKYELARDNHESQESAKRKRSERINLDELGVSIYRRTRASGE